MQKYRRLEILGILLVSISIFVLASLLGYNANEEPTISPNIQIENPMGILGLYLAHYLVKLTFGFSTIILPIIGLFWGWFLISKRKLNDLKKGSIYGLIIMVFLSITIATIEIMTSDETEINYISSGLIGGNISQLIIDWLSIWGAILFLASGYLIIFRSYFDFDYHGSYTSIKSKIILSLNKIQFKKEIKKEERKKNDHKKHLKERLNKKIKTENTKVLKSNVNRERNSMEYAK